MEIIWVAWPTHMGYSEAEFSLAGLRLECEKDLSHCFWLEDKRRSTMRLESGLYNS
jgi:hypothetical protein